MLDRSIRRVAAMLLATAACRPSAESPTTPREPTTPTTAPIATPAKLEGDAVVRVGAKLYLASTGDEGFELRSLGPSPGLAVHIVGEEQGRLAIETVAANEPHCAAVLEPFEALRVRFFVAKADLVTVLTEDFEHELDDGTKMRLSRGTPSVKAGEFVARGSVVRLSIPASQIGLAFSPGPPRDSSERNPCLEVTSNVASDDETAQKPSKSGLYAMKGPKEAVPQMDGRGDDEDEDGELGRDGVFRERERPRVVEPIVMPKHYDVKVDTPVWFYDGRRAGKVVVDHGVALSKHAENDRRCLHAPMDPVGDSRVSLCFDPAALVEAPRTGYGSGGNASNVPRVHQAKAEVEGALDPDVVRRIVRAHINEVQHCYKQGLVRDPKLAGRVAISFIVEADGSVTASDVAEMSLGDASVGECIRKAARRWKFPKPEGGGTVKITYPFNLEPG